MPHRVTLVFKGFFQTQSGIRCAIATFAGHAEGAPQVIQRAGAIPGRFTNVVVSDGLADAYVH